MKTRWINSGKSIFVMLLLVCVVTGCGEAKIKGTTRDRVRVDVHCNSMSTIVFHPSDLNKSKDFYTNFLGFAVDYSFGNVLVHGCKLSNGPVEIVLVRGMGLRPTVIENFQINLQVSNLDDVYVQMEAADIEVTLTPTKTEWGSRWFHIKDPDGLVIALEELGPSKLISIRQQ